MPVGRRPAPWLIPDEDLVAERLLTGRQIELAQPPEADNDDPGTLRTALVHYKVLATARGAHLEDLRAEVRRLHERLDQLTTAFLRLDSLPAADASVAIAPIRRAERSTAPNPNGGV